MTNADGVRASSIVRVAEFVARCGIGNKFTKLELLSAVPNVAQADRRMRDLRPLGWVIDNYKVNPTLLPDEYLVREIGTRIHKGEQSGKTPKTVSGAKRRAVFDRDGYRCQVCGAARGQTFADDPARTAQLTIGHIVPLARGGSDDESNLRAECQRCNEESRDLSRDPATAESVIAMATNVGGRSIKLALYGWMEAGRRSIDDKERVFNEWARLPDSEQLKVKAALASQVLKDL